jgi:uncharacterized membrane protein
MGRRFTDMLMAEVPVCGSLDPRHRCRPKRAPQALASLVACQGYSASAVPCILGAPVLRSVGLVTKINATTNAQSDRRKYRATVQVMPALRSNLLGRLRNYLLAGILVTAPIGITFWLTWSLISWVDQRVLPFIPARYNPETYLPFGVPGVGLIVAIIVLILIGAVTAGLVGRWAVNLSERILNRMPVIRSIYGPTKQIFEMVFGERSTAFREVVLIEFPRAGQWSIGFVSGVTKGEIQEFIEGEILSVYVPTTPNPTSGFLVFVPRCDAVALSMSAEEAFTTVISHGLVTPPDRRPPELRKRKRIPSHSSASSAPVLKDTRE